MGGVAMLLMIAASGITYGWVPDGGQGVRYIIQIPPEQLDQAKRSGELTSRIPAEIQGHVTEVVIQIGNSDVPRVTPPQLGALSKKPHQSIAANGSADLIPMSIPSLDGRTQVAPVAADSTTALMKPAPQSGMNFPGGFSLPSTAPPTTVAPPNPGENAQRQAQANSFELAQREQAQREQAQREQAQREQAQREQLARDQATRDQLARDQAARDQAARDQFARDQAQRDANSGGINPMRMAQDTLGTNSNAAAENPSTPANAFGPFAADDPRTRVNQTTAGNPSTNLFGQSLPAFTNDASGNPNAQSNPNAMSTPTNAATADNPNAWYDMRNAPPRRPSTDPIAATNPFPSTTSNSQNAGTNSQNAGGFAGTNFGQMPSGVTATNASTTSSPWPDNSRSQQLGYDPRLTAAQIARLPPGGYSYNTQGDPVDQHGNVLDQYGRPVAAQAAAATTNWPTTQSATAQPATTQAGLNDPFFRNTNPSPPIRQPYPDQIAQTGAANGTTWPARPGFNEDAATHSASDGIAWGNTTTSGGRLWPNTDSDARSSLSESTTSPPIEQMQMQSVFNALLLLSAVVNFYLFYWLKNLRLQFKEMVTSKRAAANNGLTINPT